MKAPARLLRRFGGGAEAARAHADLRARSILVVLRDLLHVYVPATPRLAMRVADVVSELRAFAADLTLCHDVSFNSARW